MKSSPSATRTDASEVGIDWVKRRLGGAATPHAGWAGRVMLESLFVHPDPGAVLS